MRRNSRTPHPAAQALGSLVALLALAGCGGAPAERPSIDELTAALQTDATAEAVHLDGVGEELSGEAYKCVAEVLWDSELTDASLAAVHDGEGLDGEQGELLHETVESSRELCSAILSGEEPEPHHHH